VGCPGIGHEQMHVREAKLARLSRRDGCRAASGRARKGRSTTAYQEDALHALIATDEEHGLVPAAAEIAPGQRARHRAVHLLIKATEYGRPCRVCRQNDDQERRIDSVRRGMNERKRNRHRRRRNGLTGGESASGKARDAPIVRAMYPAKTKPDPRGPGFAKLGRVDSNHQPSD
jgi:hypothetical protein